MNTSAAEPPERPSKHQLQQYVEKLERDLRPLRQIQEMEDLKKHLSLSVQMKEELRWAFESSRQAQEALARSFEVPRHFQDFISASSIAAQSRQMMERYFPTGLTSLGFDAEALRRATSPVLSSDVAKRAADFASISDVAKGFADSLKPHFEHQEMLERLRQSLSGPSAVDFARQLEQATSVFRAMDDASKSLNRLWPELRGLSFSKLDVSEAEEQETKQTVEAIARTAVDEESLREAVDRIVKAIQAEKRPTVQLMLWLFFRKVMDWLIAGAIGAVMGVYAPEVLDQSPQGAKKAVQENARAAVGSPELLTEYRYVSTKVLVVRQNPRALSPEVGRLTFGKPVKLLKREKDFALVLWVDKDSDSSIQGWVFSRYLEKFK